MSSHHETTVAVGGHRRVPVPDAIAHDYILLALRLDQHTPGLVDGFYGPAELKARADIEELHAPRRLVDEAGNLLDRIASDVAEPDRREWLTAQVVALRTEAEALAGERLPYLEHVARCFDWSPVRCVPGCPGLRRPSLARASSRRARYTRLVSSSGATPISR